MKRVLSIFFAVFLSLSMLAQEVPVYASQPDIQSGDISLEETEENGISEEPVEEVLEEPVEEAAEEVVEEADEAYMSSELLGDDPDPAPEPEYYHVDFYANNGTSTKLTQDIQVGLDTPLTLNRFTKTGYTFREWNDRSTGDGNAYYDGEQVRDLAASGATVNLYAQWDPNPYTVRFDANGGSCATTSMTVRYNVPYGPLPEPVRSHYNFLGWYTAVSGGSKVTEDDKYMNLMDKTLYAHWKGIDVTVNFDGNDPEASTDPEEPLPTDPVNLSVTSKIVNYDDVYGTLPYPSKTGYKFLGWYTADEKRIIYSSKVEEKTTHTLYAHWSQITYTVTFKPNGGSCSTDSIEVIYGKQYGDVAQGSPAFPSKGDKDKEPENIGYDFDGWFTGLVGGEKVTESTTVTITANQILYAHWSGVTNTVTFDPGLDGTIQKDTIYHKPDGSPYEKGECATKEVTYHKQYGALPSVKRDGYTFLGWYTDTQEKGGTRIQYGTIVELTKPNTGQTLYAHWSNNKYVVTYDAGGGQCSTKSKTVVFGEKYGTLPTPTREGYEFNPEVVGSGWYLSKTGGEEDKVTEETIVSTVGAHALYARWIALNSEVTFDANGGTVTPGTKDITYQNKYGDLPDPHRDYFDFLGWYTAPTGGERITSDTIVTTTQEQTLYAHWTGKEYQITFNANGGTCHPASKNVFYDAKYGALATASRTGYNFTGWFTEAEGGDEITADTVVSTANLDPEAADHKLFAHWEAAEYTVSFKPNGGSCDVESKTVTFDAPYGTLPQPQRIGNNFGGWYLGNPETGTLVDETTIVATGANHDLTAKWLGQPYTVTFDVNGGDELPVDERTKTVYYKENYGELPTPVREGYNFKGWYTGSEGGNQITPTTKVGVDADHTVYASWSTIRCKVDFYANGGNWNGSPTRKLDVDWNTKFDTARLIAPKYKKHAFTDWYKDPECTELFDFDQVIKTDVKIYAGWEELHLSGFDIKGLEGPFYYTGKAIKPDVTVYDYDHDYDIPLVSSKDYTLSFKSNTNAGIATVTVKGKGNYSGTQSKDFQIIAKDITGDEFAAEDIYLEYSGKGRRPAPTLTKNGRALKANKEYKLYWVNEEGVEGGLIKAPGTYPIKIIGYGNYTGERTINYVIIESSDRLISRTRVNALNREYNGLPDEPTVRVNWEGAPLTLHEDYEILWPGQNIPTDPKDTEAMTNAGTVTIRIVGKGRYVGVKKATYRILGQTILTSWIMGMAAKYEYTGGEIQPLGAADNDESLGTAAIYAPNGYKLVKGTDYTIKYTKDIVNAGEVTVTVTGKGRFQGTVSKTYKIVAAPINVLTYTKPEGVDTISVKYEKGGNEPRLQGVRINGSLAVEGRDYTLAFKNNKKVGQASMIFTGCGNFKGKYTVPFNIIRQELGDVTAVHIILSDAPNGGKPGGHEITPILRDLRTNQLLDSKDYSQKIRYLYVKSMEVTNRINKTEIKVKRFAGRPVEPGDIVPVGAELNVEIDGAGNFSGTAKAGKIKVKARDLGREKVVIYDKYYNGYAVTLTKDDIVFKGGTLMPPTDEDYDIVGYANNTRKGTATVILKGTGETFGGIKKVTFKIKQREMIFP